MKKIFNINFLFFLSLFLIFLLPPTDPDLGWHLRCGQEFWQKYTFCNLNQFSLLLPNYSWPNHYWLYQAMIFPLYQAFGFWGLTFFNGLILTLTFLFFYQAIKKYDLEKTLAILLIILFSWGVFSFGLRGQEMAIFFFSALLFLEQKARQHKQSFSSNKAIALCCPLLLLFWANMHGGSAILGIYLLMFFFFSSQSFSSFFLFVFSFLATLINPFGLKIYEDAFHHLNGPVDLSKIIAEWVPPNPPSWCLILTTTIVFSAFLIFSRKKKNIILLIFTLPLTFLALRARRNVPFYFIFFFYALLESKLLDIIKIKENFKRPACLSLIIFLLIITPFLNLPSTLKTNTSFQNYCDRSSVIYPCQAIEFLKNLPPGRQENIFNRYEWGGFLIWQLPEYKIFVDGRMPAWLTPSGKSPYTIYLETLQNQPGWQKTLDDYKIGWILIGPNTFMDLLLRDDPTKFGWKEAYRDKIAVIYQRL